MADPAALAGELRKLANTLAEAKQEINLARQQSTKSNHLYVRARRAAVQAARVIVAAVDAGCSALVPPNVLPFFTPRGPDGKLSDNVAFDAWKLIVCPFLRSKSNTLKAGAGGFDFPKVKTDKHGCVLGKDGKPRGIVPIIDPTTGETTGLKVDGEAASITDDYDESDTLEHLRVQAADWADACDVAADLIHGEIADRESAGQSDSSGMAALTLAGPDENLAREIHGLLRRLDGAFNGTADERTWQMPLDAIRAWSEKLFIGWDGEIGFSAAAVAAVVPLRLLDSLPEAGRPPQFAELADAAHKLLALMERISVKDCVICRRPFVADEPEQGCCDDCSTVIGKMAELDAQLQCQWRDGTELPPSIARNHERMAELRTIRELTCQRFAHATFGPETWERLQDWLAAAHAIRRDMFCAMRPAALIALLRETHVAPSGQWDGRLETMLPKLATLSDDDNEILLVAGRRQILNELAGVGSMPMDHATKKFGADRIALLRASGATYEKNGRLWLAEVSERKPAAPAPSPPASGEQPSLDPLSEREAEVEAYIRDKGFASGKEIANHLGVEESTVRKHFIPPLKAKRGLKNKKGRGYYFPDAT